MAISRLSLWTKKYIEVFFLAGISLKTNSPPSTIKKNSPKLEDGQNFNVIKILGYSNIGVHLSRINFVCLFKGYKSLGIVVNKSNVIIIEYAVFSN